MRWHAPSSGSSKTVNRMSSDAIAIALRVGAPVLGSPSVLDDAGVHMPEEQEDDVEAFKDFLDSVTPEDFVEHAGDEGDPGDESDDAPRG